MKIFEKIRHIRKDVLKISLTEFHKNLIGIYAATAPTYESLCRLEKGHRNEIRIKTLHMISTGLGITLRELKEGTEIEESKIVSIVKAVDKNNNTYTYNEDAIGKILTSPESSFLLMELPIKPGGITREEQDPIDIKYQNLVTGKILDVKYEKLVSVSQGKILVYVGKEKHLVRMGDTIRFPSNLPHHFENPSNKVTARCMIVQNPKSY